ncbi:MAG: cytochrome c oxidase subunit II [Rhizobiaceae bacterium]
MKHSIKAVAAAIAALGVSPVHADQPKPWGTDLQESASTMMTSISWFENYTLWFIVPITLFVAGLLVYVGWRFSEKNNPVPSKTSHNTLIEVIWTVGPVIILLFLAVPSFQLLTSQFNPPEEAKFTVKATGNQWYWSYEYQLAEPVSFDSAMVKDSERAALGKEDLAAYPRLLTVDNEMVVPINTVVRLIATGADVIHAFAMPAFGIKIDAMPGRLNETWFKAEKEGTFYGQCSEICGKDHAFMPIAIRVVDQAKYDAWMALAKTDLPGANKALMASIAAAKPINVAGN